VAALKSGLDHFRVGYNSKRAVTGPGIDKMLADIRARHLARAVGDPLRGINTFAAPVLDHEGAVVLSVTAMGPESSFDARWTSAIAKALLDCTNDISRRGWDLRPRGGNSAVCRISGNTVSPPPCGSAPSSLFHVKKAWWILIVFRRVPQRHRGFDPGRQLLADRLGHHGFKRPVL
jgi:Bacterial transcriptional regulator